MVELSMGYPISFWMLISVIPTYLGSVGTKMLRFASLLQAVVNIVVLYALLSIGLNGINGTGILVVNGVDVSGILGWLLLGFGIYTAPLLIWGTIACLILTLPNKESPSLRASVSFSEEEFYKNSHLGNHTNYFYLLDAEQIEFLENNHYKGCSYVSNKEEDGGVIKFYYHDN